MHINNNNDKNGNNANKNGDSSLLHCLWWRYGPI